VVNTSNLSAGISGTVTITATIAGDNCYYEGTATRTVNVNKVYQTVTLTPIENMSCFQVPQQMYASAPSNKAPVFFSLN